MRMISIWAGWCSLLCLCFFYSTPAQATCLRRCTAKLAFSDCSAPPTNRWPLSKKLHIALSCEDCCSPPGGPLNCSPTTHFSPKQMMIAPTNTIKSIGGTFTKQSKACGKAMLIRFDGTMKPKVPYQLLYSRMILLNFEAFQSQVEAAQEKKAEPRPELTVEPRVEPTVETTIEPKTEATPETQQDAGTPELPAPTDKAKTDRQQPDNTIAETTTTQDKGPIDTSAPQDTAFGDKARGQNDQAGKDAGTGAEGSKDKGDSTAPGCGCETTNPLPWSGALLFGFFLLWRRRKHHRDYAPSST